MDGLEMKMDGAVGPNGGVDVAIRMATPADAAGLLAIYAPYVERTAVSFEWTVPDEETFRARIASTLAHFHRCGLKFGRWYDMIWMEKLIGPA